MALYKTGGGGNEESEERIFDVLVTFSRLNSTTLSYVFQDLVTGEVATGTLAKSGSVSFTRFKLEVASNALSPSVSLIDTSNVYSSYRISSTVGSYTWLRYLNSNSRIDSFSRVSDASYYYEAHIYSKKNNL